MRRRDFVKLCGAVGATPALASCGGADGEPTDALPVIVIGAGAAGLTAAHHLAARGVDVRILEAAHTHGGRLKDAVDVVEFPLSLGAEWLHVDGGILSEIVGDSGVQATAELVGYAPAEPVGYYDGELALAPLGDVAELTFVGSSWLDFFNRHVVPGLADRIVVDRPVTRIDHSGDVVLVTDTTGAVHEADTVIVTVAPTILRDGDIEFDPPLPAALRDALSRAEIWTGFKAFIEMSTRFYPAFLEFPDSDTPTGQRLYYDAAHGQRAGTNVIGLFAVGTAAQTYQALGDDALLDRVLDELDQVFDGAASPAYLGHVVQDWSDEPFVRQAYLADDADPAVARALDQRIGDRVFLAGDSYAGDDDWGSVHVAVRSAVAAVDRAATSIAARAAARR